MKRALFVSRNLIGDMLNAGVAIREWFRLHREEYDEVDLLTIQDHVTKLYHGLGIKWNNMYTGYPSVEELNNYGHSFEKVFTLGAGEAGAYCDINKCHIIEGFCHQLDDINPPRVEMVNTQFGTFKAYHLFYNPWQTLDSLHTEIQEGLVLFSPFSASCSSQKDNQPPNKMLKPEHWVPIISFLRTLGPVRMLGAPSDQPHETWQLSEEEIMTGVPLDLLAATMKKTKLVVTIDNGMGHLASSQDAKHILFYPMVLSLNFIIPWGANFTIPIQIEPTQVQAQQLMWSVTRSAKHLEIK
jgi:hypothetical protein